MTTTTITRAASLLLTASLLAVPGCYDRGSDEALPEADTEAGDDADGSDDGNADDGNADDGDADDSDGNDETGDDGSEVAPCPAESHECAPEVPAEWNGPVITIPTNGYNAPSCTGDYDELIGTYIESPEAAPAECDCACGDPQGAVCGDEVTVAIDNVNQGSGATCGGAGEIFSTLTRNVCENLQVSLPPGSTVRVVESEIVSDGCEPSQTVNLPQFETPRVSLCQSSKVAGGCGEGEICVEQGPEWLDANVCVWHEGDVACPDAYFDRRVMYTHFSDERGCSECSCGDAEGTCDGGVWGFESPSGACAGTQTLDVRLNTGVGACEHTDDVPSSMFINTTAFTRQLMYVAGGFVGGGSAASASCEPSGAEPIGEVEGVGAITVCCQ